MNRLSLDRNHFDFTRALGVDLIQPAELRALAGARRPDLSALPPDLAGAVRAMLARLP